VAGKGKGKGKKKKEEEPKFTEEHRVLWTDLGKIIGRQGMNLKIIKASIGADINVPKQGGKDGGKGDGKGKGKDKGKNDKGKGKTKTKDSDGLVIGRGIGDGSKKLGDDLFCTVTISADTKLKANGGKRVIEIMLGYNRQVERALAELGVEAVMPSIEDMTNGKASGKDGMTNGKASGKDGKGDKNKKAFARNGEAVQQDGVDPMDPASYSDAPVGLWSAGMKKPGQKAGRNGPEPRDSKTANAERF